MAKVFMNAQGQYLQFELGDVGGFSNSKHWTYQWVKDVNQATVKLSIPSNDKDKWQFNDNPSNQVVAEIEATVVTTRVVTLVKA